MFTRGQTTQQSDAYLLPISGESCRAVLEPNTDRLTCPLVGSRNGAILRRSDLSGAPRFLWECLTNRTVRVSIPRHVERSMQISRTPLSCSLCRKVYETQPIGGAFNPVRSPASTPHHPTASAFLFLYILCLRSCRLPSVFIRRPCLPSLPEELRNSWVPSLPGSYPSSSLLQTLPPPSRLPSFSRG